jgi:class 3 adenylate cyclase
MPFRGWAGWLIPPRCPLPCSGFDAAFEGEESHATCVRTLDAGNDVGMVGSGAARRTATVSVLFCDLVGSTERQARLGDDASDEFRRRFYAALRDAVARTGGEEVKNTGDGLMVVFRRSALDAVTCAVAMHETVGSLDADEPVQIYVGISAGEAAEDDNDWFGTPVNEAARLCAAAKPGQTLANEVVRSLVGSRGTFEFRSVRPLTLKGLPAPIAAVEVVTRAEIGSGLTRVQPRHRRQRRTALLAGSVIGAVVLGIAATIVILALSGHSRSAPPEVPSLDSQASGYTPKLVTRSCNPGENGGDASVTCMTLIVPEDRDHPLGNSVRLPVVYVRATNPKAPPEVGFAGLSSPPGGIDLSSVADQYLLTIRGDIGSQPTLTCKDERDNRKRRLGMDTPTARRTLYQELDACRTRLVAEGVNLDKYGPNDVADDVRDLARALHLHKIDLRLFKKGALPGYALLHRFPSLVHAMLLNTPSTPDDDPLNEATNAAAALADYDRRCSASSACTKIAPHFNAMVSALFAEWSARPRKVTVSSPDGSSVTLVLDGDRLMEAIWIALHDYGAYPVLAGAIASRDASLVGVYIALNDLGRPTPEGVEPDVGSIVWACESRTAIAASQLQTARAAYPQWSAVIDGDALDRCTRWGIGAQADLIAPVSGATPAFIVAGELEPEHSAIERVHGELPASQLISLNGLASGDANAWPACVPQLRRAFVLAPLSALDTDRCGRSTPPVAYVPVPAASSIP